METLSARDQAPRPPRLAHFELGPAEALDEPRRMAWVEAVEELVVRVAEAAGLDRNRASDFGVAVREAVVNALRHGEDPQHKRVAVGLRLSNGPALVVTVRDHGRGFDPAALPDPRSPENLSRGCGRGVFYMRQLADQVAFAFPRRGGTVTRLWKRLPPTGRGSDPGLEEWLGPVPGQPDPGA